MSLQFNPSAHFQVRNPSSGMSILTARQGFCKKFILFYTCELCRSIWLVVCLFLFHLGLPITVLTVFFFLSFIRFLLGLVWGVSLSGWSCGVGIHFLGRITDPFALLTIDGSFLNRHVSKCTLGKKDRAPDHCFNIERYKGKMGTVPFPILLYVHLLT